jgi:nucleotide-binding universal stress UspA family protein
MIEAAHVDALEADRQRAPCGAAGGTLSGGNLRVSVTSKVLEGSAADAILDEAERWRADLIVVGSHGYGPVTRRLLGSVSQAVALRAPCSLEVVRCPQDGAVTQP